MGAKKLVGIDFGITDVNVFMRQVKLRKRSAYLLCKMRPFITCSRLGRTIHPFTKEIYLATCSTAYAYVKELYTDGLYSTFVIIIVFIHCRSYNPSYNT